MPALLVPGEVDPRGLRFAAGVTAVVLAAVILTESVAALAAQALVFAIGAFAGVRRSPYSLIYAHLVRPHLAPPSHTEDARPPQFAQAVGFGFAVLGLAGFAAGADVLGLVATGLALAAAFLNAAFGLCLGCELYLVSRRVRSTIVKDSHNDRARTPTEVSA
jgi:Domain of unknown function (DUF4395)